MRSPRRPATAAALAAPLAAVLAGGCAPAARPSGAPAAATPAPSAAAPTASTTLTADETRMRDAVRAHYDASIDLLARAVDIPSGTHNLAGVRRVGDLFATELQQLGFRTRWVDAPAGMRRAGHLVAEHPGQGARLLLIGHLDTVFEGDDQKWVRQDTIARGAGTGDMKGGDVAMVLALRALKEAGQLERMHVTVIMTGDEEAPGQPIAAARTTLTDLARASDVALAFEGGSRSQISVTRRGSSSWTLEVKARQAHSAGVFSEGAGYGAIYEGARVIDEFRRTLSGQPGLTFNVGLVGGGTAAATDTSLTRITSEGKTNIIAPTFVARGDLRFLREAQKDSTRAAMRAIVARPLNGATSTITFTDGYPAMPATDAGARLVAAFDGTSRALGYGAVQAQDASSRGAGDVSFVAPFIPGMDGLGVSGRGAHSPQESVSLPSLRMAAERAAVLMSRLSREWPRRPAS
ncbi:M20/M25/M40 family metallo-hydrolase [Roseisolibacter agri]|uniref:Peptidase M20 n=1 Tax=Roseisolibacter agri TaxID=2014610 RepID=A0AA37QF17_9BACT|nr:M20/M25/M40 family metallo-hydrolase [Roseisolibacter agri]GLC24548.1 peptidase M20 [Roseisolibacter agri]